MNQAGKFIVPPNASLAVLNNLFSQALSSGDTDAIVEIGKLIVEESNKINEEMAEREKLDAERKAKEELLKQFNANPRSKPTLHKIYLRRSSEEDIAAKVQIGDVFDDIALQDIKAKHSGKGRIFTSEDELKVYQGFKAAGKENIVFSDIEAELERLRKLGKEGNSTGEQGSPEAVAADSPVAGEEPDANGQTEDSDSADV